MNRRIVFALLAVVAVLSVSTAIAQCNCGGTASAPSYSTYYAPSYATSYSTYYTPSYASSYSTYYTPSYATYYAPAPQVSYYAPAVQATYYAPAPQVTYYAPAPQVAYYAPTPQVTYYAPQAAYYAPVAQPCVNCYDPVVAARVVYGVPGRSMFGAPRLYVPGQPVRNTFRAITP
jgi:hypothetical protein